MYCTKCGKNIPNNDGLFCPYCGASLFARAPLYNTGSTQSKENTARSGAGQETASNMPRKHNPEVTNNGLWASSILLISIVVVSLIVLGTTSAVENKSSDSRGVSLPSTAATETTPAATVKPHSIYSSYAWKEVVASDYNDTCPFGVNIDDEMNYYIYLEYVRAPLNSYEARQLNSNAVYPYEEDVSFYLQAGNVLDVDVPVGVYKLYYATGDVFYSSESLFGDDTVCYSSDELLEFYVSAEYYEGNTLTLYSVYDGNFDTDEIDLGEFPIRG